MPRSQVLQVVLAILLLVVASPVVLATTTTNATTPSGTESSTTSIPDQIPTNPPGDNTPTTTPGTTTAAETTTTTSTTAAAGGGEEYEQIIDDYTRLESWHYDRDAGQIVLEIDASRPQVVEVYPSQQLAEGTGQGSFARERIPSGGGTITVPAEPVEGVVSASIFTDETREEQRYVYVSRQTAADLPLDRTAPEVAWVGGAVIMFTMTIAAGWLRIRKEDGAPKRAFK